jgi:ATP-binding protein involved in chromosome partitioning
MPTDHSTIKWACDLCGTAWTGPDSAHTAAACEATGAPEPLPPETWLLRSGFGYTDEMTTGGFQLARLGDHTIANTRWMSTTPPPGPQQHVLRYGAYASSSIDSSHIFPHQPGVLNLTNISSPAHHDDRIETLLRDPDTAEEFAAMLAGFGVTLAPARIAKLASDVYSSLDFGLDSVRRYGQANALPPLASMPPELQAAFRAVAATKALAKDPSDTLGVLTPALEVMHQYRESNGNIALATARLLTGFGESLSDRAARWWNGEDVALLPSALIHAGGIKTKGGNLGLSSEQRDVLRSAGFEVPWPVRFKNTDTINSPHAALKALLATITLLEAPMPETKKLFDVDESIAVASGKGGVGKTTVAAALAKALNARGKTVLAIDLDFHGPSLGHLLDLGHLTMSADAKIIPSTLADGTRAISLSQFLAPNSPVTWRGTAVEGFLLFLGARLDLTGIDTIVFDLPPGTGDVERAVMKYARPDGAVLVTTGSDLSHADCRRAGMFLQNHGVPIVGVVENLSRRTVTTPGGETVELRIFGEEADTIAFTAGLEFHNGWRTRYAPDYLGSLPFGADPDTLAASPEFAAVADAAETCAPEPEDPEGVTSRTFSLAMTIDPAMAAALRG